MAWSIVDVTERGRQLQIGANELRLKSVEDRGAAFFTSLASLATALAAAFRASENEWASYVVFIFVAAAVVLFLVGLSLLRKSSKRTPVDSQTLSDYITGFVETAGDAEKYLDPKELLTLQAAHAGAISLVRDRSAMDDGERTRKWISSFIQAMTVPRPPRCFSFHSEPIYEHVSTHQFQVIATQVRMCMGPQSDPVGEVLHDHQSSRLARTMHVNSVQNLRALAVHDHKYAAGYLLGSRVNIGTHAEPTEPGLVRLLFWTEWELRQQWAQQYIDVWDSFGIPVFWLEKSERTCRAIAELIMKRDKQSRIRQMFEKLGVNARNIHPSRWPRDLDFFIVGEQVLLGYEEKNGGLDWDAGADEFYEFAMDIVDKLRSEIYYAKEISWYRDTLGQRLLRNGTGGFVFPYDFFTHADRRLPSNAQPTVAPPVPESAPPSSAAESTPAPVTPG